MPDRIPHSNQEIITGQQTTTNYLGMQKMLGKFYLRKFFAILDGQHKTGRFLELGSGSGYQGRLGGGSLWLCDGWGLYR
jgi:hypothetical protein